VDERLRLRDRLATAVQLTSDRDGSGMGGAMIDDALTHLVSATPAAAYPLRAHRSTRLLGALLLVLLAVQLAPIPPFLVSEQERQERALLQKDGAEIEPLAKQLREQADKADDAEARKAARKLRKLALQMKHGKLDRKQALLSLKDMDKELQKLEKRVAPRGLKTAQKAAEQMTEAERNRLADQARQMAKQAAKKGDRQLANKLNKLADKAKKATNRELKELSRQLRNQSAKLGAQYKLPGNLPASLSAALAQQDWEAVLQHLDNMTTPLDQLEGQLSKEEMDALAQQMDDLAEALEGTDLGEMCESLREIAKCLRKGQCKKAARCLAKATRACQGRAARLALCKGCGACRKGLAGCCGSRSGSGMCIGPDDGSQQSIPPNADPASLYDPRQTETSGDAQRVRARVRPQGPMLTITEKAPPVMISGSEVPYYEVIGEYSRVAEEALAREEVPPLYRKTVREYFDALQGSEEE